MSIQPPLGGSARFRAVIDCFIQDRMQAKLDKLKPDDPEYDEVRASFARDIWLASAAKRVEQIQAVTHSLKPIHPDARGTNLYVEPSKLPALEELGSHALGEVFDIDVVGNAAALDVYKLLKLRSDGRSLLTALLANDSEALSALHDNPQTAAAWRDALVSLTQSQSGAASSHPLAKQLYWLTGEDPCDDASYELLAPLFATSLAHAIFKEIHEDRFGETNKAARLARREGKAHEGVFHDYPGLAVQKMGGTKPQNISQLNSDRSGVNYLLSCLPPMWDAPGGQLPVRSESVFEKLFAARPEVKSHVRKLRTFLESDPAPNQATRDRRDTLLDGLLDELVAMAGELQECPAGWTRDNDRFATLAMDEKLWLDPLRSQLPEESDFARQWMWMDWPEAVGKRFARWLNAQLGHKLPVGDVEALQWKELLTDEDGFVQQLRELRATLQATSLAVAQTTSVGDSLSEQGGAT